MRSVRRIARFKDQKQIRITHRDGVLRLDFKEAALIASFIEQMLSGDLIEVRWVPRQCGATWCDCAAPEKKNKEKKNGKAQKRTKPRG